MVKLFAALILIWLLTFVVFASMILKKLKTNSRKRKTSADADSKRKHPFLIKSLSEQGKNYAHDII